MVILTMPVHNISQLKNIFPQGFLLINLKTMARKKKKVMEVINQNAAGIDEGSKPHFVAVRALVDVKEFGVYAEDLVELCNGKFTKKEKRKKTDAQNGRWIQKIHSRGLLSDNFFPDKTDEILRTYCCQRTNWIDLAVSESHKI